MPMYIEYDKITREIRRVLSANDLPADAAHLSYVEVPVGTPEIDPTADVDTARRIIDAHVSGRPVETQGVEPEPEPKRPLVEEV